MVHGKYTRLPSKEPECSEIRFEALDGPSYFSYGIPRGKYKSVFTYSSLNLPDTQNVDDSQQSFTCFLCHKLVSVLCYLIFLVTLPISLLFTLKVIKSFERYVILRLGRYQRTAGPGYIIVLPCIDGWEKVDLRMKAFSVPPQKVITTDNAVIEIGAEVFYNVIDPLKSVNNIQDLNHSTRIISQISLQKHVGRRNLAEIESARQHIIGALKEDVNEATMLWGVEVTKIELSPTKLYSKPNQLIDQSNNPLSLLGPVLFPPGSSNPPIEQLQYYFGLAGKALANANKMVQEPTQGFSCDSQRSNEKQASSTLMKDVEQMIDKISVQLNHSIVKDFNLMYKFIITADSINREESGIFYLDLKTGEGKAGSGYPFLKEPDVTLTMTGGVLQDLMFEKLSPFNAYMSGQLTVLGDLKGAMKLGNIIENLKRC